MADAPKPEGGSSLKPILWIMFGLFLINSTGASVNGLFATSTSTPTNTAAVGLANNNSSVSNWRVYSQTSPTFSLRYHPDYEITIHQRNAENGFITFTNRKVYLSPATGDMNPTIELAYTRTDKPMEQWLREFHNDQTIVVSPGDVGTYRYSIGLQRKTGFVFKRGGYNYYLEAITATDVMRTMAESMGFSAS